MSRLLMMIALVISAILLAIGATSAAMWISKRINNKRLACLISMMLGIALVIILLILAYWVFPVMLNIQVVKGGTNL